MAFTCLSFLRVFFPVFNTCVQVGLYIITRAAMTYREYCLKNNLAIVFLNSILKARIKMCKGYFEGSEDWYA